MMCVVTGATGCLGLNLTTRLLKEGHRVIALGRNKQIGTQIAQLGASFEAIDLSESKRLHQLARGADVIFHCAAFSSSWGRKADCYQVNVIGTRNVIQAMPASARLVHVSSSSVYFDFTEKHNIKENMPLSKQPANEYIKSKILAERLLDKAILEQQLNVVTIRPRAIFGPYDLALIPKLLRAEKHGVLPIVGTGRNIIDVTYVDNVVESMLLAATSGTHVCGKKYNITNDEPKSLVDILTLLYQALKKPLKIRYISYPLARTVALFLECMYRILPLQGEPRLTRFGAGVLALGQTLNIDAAKQDLHYAPIVSLEQGMHHFAKWYSLS